MTDEECRDWFIKHGRKSEVVQKGPNVGLFRTESRKGNVVVNRDFCQGIEQLAHLEAAPHPTPEPSDG